MINCDSVLSIITDLYLRYTATASVAISNPVISVDEFDIIVSEGFLVKPVFIHRAFGIPAIHEAKRQGLTVSNTAFDCTHIGLIGLPLAVDEELDFLFLPIKHEGVVSPLSYEICRLHAEVVSNEYIHLKCNDI